MTKSRLITVSVALWMAVGCSAPVTSAPVTDQPTASTASAAVTSTLADVAEAPQFSSSLDDVADTDQVQIRVTPHVFREGDPDFHFDGAEACPGAELSEATGVLVVDLTARTDTYREVRELVLTFTADQEPVGAAAPAASWRKDMVQRGSHGLSAAVQPGPGLSLGDCAGTDDQLGIALPLRVDPTAASTRFRTFVVIEDWFDHATDRTLPSGLTLAVGLDLLDDAGAVVIGQHGPTHRNALDTGEQVPCPTDGIC